MIVLWLLQKKIAIPMKRISMKGKTVKFGGGKHLSVRWWFWIVFTLWNSQVLAAPSLHRLCYRHTADAQSQQRPQTPLSSRPRLQRSRCRSCCGGHLSSHRRPDLVPLQKEPFALGKLLFSSIWKRNEWRWDYASFFPWLNSSKSLLICTNILGKMSHLKVSQCQYLLCSKVQVLSTFSIV